MDEKELHQKLEAYKEAKARIREWEAALSALEDDIKGYMGEKEELMVEGIQVRWTPYTVSRFDTASFKREHKALYEAYLKTAASRRFSVT